MAELETGTEILIQQGPVSLDDLSVHLGQWVVLREKRVVETASDATTLVRSSNINDGDEVLFVTDTGVALIL